MTLTFSARLEARNFDVSVQIPEGGHLAVMGPNGAGKSTLVSLISGILAADEGRAILDGRVLFDHARNVWAPPHRRRVALLSQDPSLFPHLSVLDNVAFGPRSSGLSTKAAHRKAFEYMERLGVEKFASRRPRQLSGGQAQRVALARAMAAEPRLLLLDEPMAALDVDTAPRLRQMLREVADDLIMVIVTHDVLDAVVLSDHVMAIESGKVVEFGRTNDVLMRPRSPFVARIAGFNLVEGTFRDERLETGHGLSIDGVRSDLGNCEGPGVAVFRPNSVAIHGKRPESSARNVLSVRITGLEPYGDAVRVRAVTGPANLALAADVLPASVAELALTPGSEAFFEVKATQVSLYSRSR